MDIGIVTIIDNGNFGNRLQNYAVQEVLRSLGHNAVTIRNTPIFNTEASIPAVLTWQLWCMVTRRYRPRKKITSQARKHSFDAFDQNITFTQKLYFGCKHYDECDYYLAGSDQIWNPHYRLYPMDVLCFAKPEKRIAFSASFGVSQIPEDKKKIIRDEIALFRAISVREDAGRRIIEELTGRTDVQVLVDPTMLLSTEQWDRVAKKPEMLKTKHYILNYFLGTVTEEQRAAIDAVAQENNCEVINILDPDSPFYTCGPSEFLYLEKHAFLICTDSFHSSVFAVLYDRPFVIFDRPMKQGKAMNSRIDTLLEKLQLIGRKFDGNQITQENLRHDYTQAYTLLARERERAEEFLKKTIIERQ